MTIIKVATVRFAMKRKKCRWLCDPTHWLIHMQWWSIPSTHLQYGDSFHWTYSTSLIYYKIHYTESIIKWHQVNEAILNIFFVFFNTYISESVSCSGFFSSYYSPKHLSRQAKVQWITFLPCNFGMTNARYTIRAWYCTLFLQCPHHSSQVVQ